MDSLKRVVAVVAGVGGLSAGVLVGCGGGSSNGNMAAFCRDNATLDKASIGVTDPAKAIDVLKANQSTVNDFAKTAPSAIKSDVNLIVTAARRALASNDISPLTTPQIQAAGTSVDAFCGQNANGTSTGSQTTTT